MIGESFYRQGDFASANGAFRDAITSDYFGSAYLGMARSLLKLGRSHAARHYALVIRDSALLRPAIAVAAESFFQKFDFTSGVAIAGRYPGDSVLGIVTGMDGKGISQRSPALSAALSTMIPGLGQTYSGRLGDGLFSFTLVATAAAVSWYTGTGRVRTRGGSNSRWRPGWARFSTWATSMARRWPAGTTTSGRTAITLPASKKS